MILSFCLHILPFPIMAKLEQLKKTRSGQKFKDLEQKLTEWRLGVA